MKNKYFLVILFFLIIILFIFLFLNQPSKSTLISSNNYKNTLELGLKSEAITEKDILYLEPIKDTEKLIIITKNNALAVCCLSKNNNTWSYKRLGSFISFESDSSYITDLTKLETIKNNKYYFLSGEIFNSNIKRIAIYSNEVMIENVTLKTKNNNTFFFAILDDSLVNDDLSNNLELKAYDEVGNIIK